MCQESHSTLALQSGTPPLEKVGVELRGTVRTTEVADLSVSRFTVHSFSSQYETIQPWRLIQWHVNAPPIYPLPLPPPAATSI